MLRFWCAEESQWPRFGRCLGEPLHTPLPLGSASTAYRDRCLRHQNYHLFCLREKLPIKRSLVYTGHLRKTAHYSGYCPGIFTWDTHMIQTPSSMDLPSGCLVKAKIWLSPVQTIVLWFTHRILAILASAPSPLPPHQQSCGHKIHVWLIYLLLWCTSTKRMHCLMSYHIALEYNTDRECVWIGFSLN